ncbi:MAG: hypothetical protein M5U26_21645 [Planctomycetota bacterium]|nr:hypothetical protein [Planctomycetota bacterium]
MTILHRNSKLATGSYERTGFLAWPLSLLAILIPALVSSGVLRAVEAAPSPELLPALLRGDQEAQLSRLLGLSKEDLAPYLPILIEWLKDGGPTRRKHSEDSICEALTVLTRAEAHEGAPVAAQFLTKADAGSSLGMASAKALHAMSTTGLEQARKILENLKPDRADAAWNIAHAFNADTKPLVPLFVAAIQRAVGEKSLQLLWESLGRLPAGGLDEGAEGLVEALKAGKYSDEHLSAYWIVIRGVGDLKPFKEHLIEWLQDDKIGAQHLECLFLGAMKLGVDDSDLIEAVLARGRMGDGEAMLEPLSFLRTLQSPRGAEPMCDYLKNPKNDLASAYALLGLSELKMDLKPYKPLLVKLLVNGEEYQQGMAAQAIALGADAETGAELTRTLEAAEQKRDALLKANATWIEAQNREVKEAETRLAEKGTNATPYERHEWAQKIQGAKGALEKREAELQRGLSAAGPPAEVRRWGLAALARWGSRPDERRKELWGEFLRIAKEHSGKRQSFEEVALPILYPLAVAGRSEPGLLKEQADFFRALRVRQGARGVGRPSSVLGAVPFTTAEGAANRAGVR